MRNLEFGGKEKKAELLNKLREHLEATVASGNSEIIQESKGDDISEPTSVMEGMQRLLRPLFGIV